MLYFFSFVASIVVFVLVIRKYISLIRQSHTGSGAESGHLYLATHRNASHHGRTGGLVNIHLLSRLTGTRQQAQVYQARFLTSKQIFAGEMRVRG